MSIVHNLAIENYSDEEFSRRATEVLTPSKDITVKAVRGYVIVAFLPYRRHGQVVVPDRYKDESCEAIVIDDQSGYCLPAGTKVICSRGDGTYFEVEGIRFCRIKGKSMYAIETKEAA